MRTPQENSLKIALKACKGSFISVGIFSFFINTLMLAPALYMMQVFNRVITSYSLTTLLMLTLILTGLLLVKGLLDWIRSRILIRVSNKLDFLLSKEIYQASFKQALATGGMNASAQPLNDLTGLRQFLTGNGLLAFFDVPWLPIYLGAMFIFHPLYGWFAVGAAVLLLMFAVLNEYLTGKKLAAANREYIAVNLQTTKSLRNAEVIESMGMLQTLMQRWRLRLNKVLKLQSFASDRGGLVSSLSKTIRVLSQSLIMALGAYLVIEQEINPGVMMAGSILLGRALSPIDQIIGGWKSFVAARDQYQRLNETLDQLQAEPERMSLPAPEGHISVEKLIIGAPGAKISNPILKNISFSVTAGSVVGIVGASASGKSTLARALLGIWAPQHGVVRLDGADINNWNKHELGPYIGYLPQDIELFEGSISENIARFGDPQPEKIIQAAKMASVHEMILQLPNGYDTVIGSDGVNLSGGQRQRIGLARAIYGMPRLIVLDEPNSNLDEVGEVALARAIQQLKAAKATLFIVTHRQGILAQVDYLMMLSNGGIDLYGPKAAVLAELGARQQKNVELQKSRAPATLTGPQSVAKPT